MVTANAHLGLASVTEAELTEHQQYCPYSEHPRKLHGVMPRDKEHSYETLMAYGPCCYCHQTVWAYIDSSDPWRTTSLIYAEEPY